MHLQKIIKFYNYLFSYNKKALTVYGQQKRLISMALTTAFLKRGYIMLTMQNGDIWIGQIIKRISPQEFAFRVDEQNRINLIKVKDVCRVDFP
ncbi:MAG: hypothetical protein Q3960_02350 [Lactobacillus sp.]|nr:hypothetical protein [Lactobacillus sp.]